MLDRILVPLDGSVTAEAILPQVRRLLKGHAGQVILVQAVLPMPVEAYAAGLEVSLSAAEEYLKGIAERTSLKGLDVAVEARGGVASDVILNVARERNASLIAMATHGRTGLSRVVLGSTAEQIVRHSPFPIFALRPFWSYELKPAVRAEDQPVRTILLPLDGSPVSEAVVPDAIRFARAFGSRVLLLRALAADEGRESEAYLEADGQLNRVAGRFKERGLEAMALIEHGKPDTVIQDIARFHHADLVVMATHGKGGLRRMVTGSVTEDVLRHSKAPLLIVNDRKRSEQEASGAVSTAKLA